MRLDDDYTFIRRCPSTGGQVFHHQWSHSGGVCHHCGHVGPRTFTHAVKIVGRWEHPSLLERLLGKKPIFHPKVPQ